MKRRYGLLKPLPDVHTLGINTIKGLLLDCGETVLIADESISRSFQETGSESEQLHRWLTKQHITHLGLSYRLDPQDALSLMDQLIDYLKKNRCLQQDKGWIHRLYFAGLPESCDRISQRFGTLITVFSGEDSVFETMSALDVPQSKIPSHIFEGSRYDEERAKLAAVYIQSADHTTLSPVINERYPEFGTRQDSLSLRLLNRRLHSDLPLTRVHVGPYQQDRQKAVTEFEQWCSRLAKNRYLDICSIGSSQLTQSHFGQDWTGLKNGGGVPIQTAAEYERIYACSRPMLLRTYSGTSQVDHLVKVHEDSLNIAWHALSLWWFNQIDGRGPNDLLTNLHQHTEALKLIARHRKPFEPNVPHHFSFRGADDLTYVVSAVLSARVAKQYGIQDFVLQVMLNTPRSTWGMTDLAKARSILAMIAPLKDEHFNIILQPRAGLDYFSPNLDEAKIQLASVSMLMDDIEPQDQTSPDIIHVVSYSEAVHLATPDIIDDSIKITLGAVAHYRQFKKTHDFLAPYEAEIQKRTQEFIHEATLILNAIDAHLEDFSSPVALAALFESGFLPAPYLWGNTQKYPNATHFGSRFSNGTTILTDQEGHPVSTQARIDYALSNLEQCHTRLKSEYQELLSKLSQSPGSDAVTA
jgi:hypothetical protein